jgi:hypothetical protein
MVEVLRHRVVKGSAADAMKVEWPSHNLPDLSKQMMDDLSEQRLVFGSEEKLALSLLYKVLTKPLDIIERVSTCRFHHMVALMNYYVRLQIELRVWPVASSRNLLAAARSTIGTLAKLATPNPLTHHFAAQAARVLLQLADFSDTRDEAESLIGELEYAVNKYVPAEDTTSFDALVREVLARRRERRANSAAAAAAAATASPLEQMVEATITEDGGVAAAAEAAVAAAAVAQAQMGSMRKFDGELMDRSGYVNALMEYRQG